MRNLLLVLIAAIAIITLIRALETTEAAEFNKPQEAAAELSINNWRIAEVYYNNSMAFSEQPVTISKNPSFSSVVDEACDRLMDRQAKYSIRRIQEMGDRLTGLEQELDEFLVHKDGKQDD